MVSYIFYRIYPIPEGCMRLLWAETWAFAQQYSIALNPKLKCATLVALIPFYNLGHCTKIMKSQKRFYGTKYGHTI